MMSPVRYTLTRKGHVQLCETLDRHYIPPLFLRPSFSTFPSILCSGHGTLQGKHRPAAIVKYTTVCQETRDIVIFLVSPAGVLGCSLNSFRAAVLCALIPSENHPPTSSSPWVCLEHCTVMELFATKLPDAVAKYDVLLSREIISATLERESAHGLPERRK